MTKILPVVLLFCYLLTGGCTNIGLADYLENPGGSEKFTNNYYVFVSEWVTSGNMAEIPYTECQSSTGANRADCACTYAAIRANLRRSKNHVFRAWLSTGTSDANCRLIAGANACTLPVTDAYLNTQGQTVAGSFVNLANSILQKEVRYTQSGADIGPDLVWTGTSAAGTATGSTCTDWGDATSGITGTVGSRITTGTWSDMATPTGCNTAQRIYCVASPGF